MNSLVKTKQAIDLVIDEIDAHYMTGNETAEECFKIISRIDEYLASKIDDIFTAEAIKKIMEGNDEV